MKKGITETICFLLVFLFIYTGISKLFDQAVFHKQLLAFPFIKEAAPAVAYALPLTELTAAALLLLPKLRLYGLYTSTILLVCFTLFLAAMLSFSTKLPCSCGGVIALLSWKQHIAFNLFFTGLSITGIHLQKSIAAPASKHFNAAHKNIVATTRDIRKPVEKSRKFFY